MEEKKKVLKVTEPVEETMSERFTKMVIHEFGGQFSGEIRVTDYQRHLIQGYFICIDRTIKKAEKDRLKKNQYNKDHKYDNKLEYIWNNVNLHDLVLDIIHTAKMGLDMMQDNHLYAIPYKNNKLNKYDIELMKGYNGIQYVAEKYAVEKPIAVTIDLVFSTDDFSPLKKNKDNFIENYDFKINKPFARGEILGGFGYIEYANPKKNKLIVMTLKDILKRKPEYAAAQFWGGTVKKWKNGTATETKIEGWYEEMCLKTVKREVYSAKNIPRDPEKIDDAYQYMRLKETKQADSLARAEIELKANGEVIDTSYTDSEKVKKIPPVETRQPEEATNMSNPKEEEGNVEAAKVAEKKEPQQLERTIISESETKQEDGKDKIEFAPGIPDKPGF